MSGDLRRKVRTRVLVEGKEFRQQVLRSEAKLLEVELLAQRSRGCLRFFSSNNDDRDRGGVFRRLGFVDDGLDQLEGFGGRCIC